MRNFEQEKKGHPDEQWFCSICGAENYGLAYWCIVCDAFPGEKNNKKLQTEATGPCTLNCVVPSKDCCDFESVGCQWPR